MVVFSVKVKKDYVQHLFFGWGDRIGPLKNEQKVESNYKGFLPSIGRKHLCKCPAVERVRGKLSVASKGGVGPE
jgi:hypothetical protein